MIVALMNKAALMSALCDVCVLVFIYEAVVGILALLSSRRSEDWSYQGDVDYGIGSIMIPDAIATLCKWLLLMASCALCQ